MASNKTSLIFVLIVGMLAAVVLAVLPEADSAAFMVALMCSLVGVGAISLLKDPRERIILTRLFLVAFAARISFSLMLFKSGLTAIFAGGDDAVWELGWLNSRIWRGQITHKLTGPHGFAPSDFPANFPDMLHNVRENIGYHYLATWFYYLLDIHSQMALAFLNCFVGALTVILTYKVAREYFSEKACCFISWAAALLPALLIWSALTIKESWVILFQITIFFAVQRCAKRFNPWYAGLIVFLIVVTLTFRFYIAQFIGGSVIIGYLCLRSQRPGRTAMQAFVGVTFLFTMLSLVGVLNFDITSIAMDRLKEFNYHKTVISTGKNGITAGTGSGVKLDYDVTTPRGALMMIGVGSIYLMMSPFPWQMTSLRQILALPDVLIWYYFLFGYVLPGIRYGWQKERGLVISVGAFILPLILFYSISFGNVGLVYRQRAQLMPFLFILAAAGYDRKKKAVKAARQYHLKPIEAKDWSPQPENAPVAA